MKVLGALKYLFFIFAVCVFASQSFALERSTTSSNAGQAAQQESTKTQLQSLIENIATLQNGVIQMESKTIWVEDFSCADGEALAGFNNDEPVCEVFEVPPKTCSGSNPGGCRNGPPCSGGWHRRATYACIDGSWTFTGCVVDMRCEDPAGI